MIPSEAGSCSVQVYRSVLLHHAHKEPVADENMEVDPTSGGECKLLYTASPRTG